MKRLAIVLLFLFSCGGKAEYTELVPGVYHVILADEGSVSIEEFQVRATEVCTEAGYQGGTIRRIRKRTVGCHHGFEAYIYCRNLTAEEVKQ